MHSLQLVVLPGPLHIVVIVLLFFLIPATPGASPSLWGIVHQIHHGCRGRGARILQPRIALWERDLLVNSTVCQNA